MRQARKLVNIWTQMFTLIWCQSKNGKKFDLQIKGQSDTQTIIMPQSPLAQQPIVHDLEVEKASNKDSTRREVEIIPKNPSS